MIRNIIPAIRLRHETNQLAAGNRNWKRSAGWILLLLSMLTGAVIGAVSGRSADAQMMKDLDIIFLTNFRMRADNGAFAVFSASFASNFIFLFTVFLAGTSMWGFMPVLLVPFIKGYGYGLIMGHAYSEYSLSGILYNLIIVLPGAIFSAFVISSAVREAFSCSAAVLRLFRKKTDIEDSAAKMHGFVLYMLWLLFLAAAASGLDMLCSLMFSWLFDF